VDILIHLYQVDNKQMNQRKMKFKIYLNKYSSNFLFRVSRGATVLNSLPPIMMNKSQKM